MRKKIIYLFIVNIIIVTSSFSQNGTNSLNFDGLNDYIEFNSLASSMTGSTNFTIEFWMKADLNNQPSSIRTTMFSINPITNNGNGLLMILGGTNTQEGKLMIYDENTFGANADFKSNVVIGDSTCHHIAYVRNGNIGLIYIDGINVGSHTTNFILSANDLYSLGQEWDDLTTTPLTSQFYNGDMDDFRVWNTSRTATEIQNNMNVQLVGNEPNLLAYYTFNQGISGGNNSGVTTLIDNTANGLNGMLNSFALNGPTSNWVVNPCDSIVTDVSENIAFEKESITLYPNPNRGQFTIDMEDVKEALVEIYDIRGQKVFTESNVNSKGLINITDQPTGFYFVKITSGNNIKVKKIIKN